MFEAKKIISSLLMPLPALLILGFIGLALIMFTRRRRFGCMVIFTALAGLFSVSYYPVSSSLLMPMERQYTSFTGSADSIDYIMVLGHSHVVDNSISPVSELSRTALMRLAEGISIHRLYPGSKLILSGYSGGTDTSHARMMAKVAIALGVSKSDIVLLESAQDTAEEAQQAAGFVRQKSMVLVTSASHMQRSLIEFERVGLDPIPAPTNFMAQRDIEQPWSKYTPRASYLEQTELYWHEKLGQWWQWMKETVSSQ
jgi:uncharacterized SAM-binding protein YcdF (DUF218 family)